MNKPKLNESLAGVTLKYDHDSKGHWIDNGIQRFFVKRRDRALELFKLEARAAFGRGLKVV